MAERIPTRDELRAALLWCARMLMSYDGRPVAGPIAVKLSLPEEREAKLFRPKGTREGMEPPTWFALAEEEHVGASVSELLGVLLSPDESKLLRDLVTNGPCTASSVHDRCKATLSKSDFWAVWGQLQKRRLVEQGDDERYRVGPTWLAEWLKGK